MISIEQDFTSDDWEATDTRWPGLTGHGTTMGEAHSDLQRQIAEQIRRDEQERAS